MKTKILLIIIAISLQYNIAKAQQAEVQKAENFILTTNPSGATAYFNGEYDLVVNTPATLPANLVGKYTVKIMRPGYEAWKGQLAFLPESPISINIKLRQKSRFRAGLRSFFIPGWGQRYEGSNFRGMLFTTGIITSAGILIYSDSKFQDKRTAYDIAIQNCDGATSIDQRILLKAVKDDAQRSAYRAETNRRRVFFVGLGLWIYNIIDSMVFFPEESGYYPTVTATDGGANLSFVVKF